MSASHRPSHRRATFTLFLAAALIAAALIIGGPEPADARPARHTPSYRAWVIRQVFGRYGTQAVRVARCESGPSLSTHARNGQFRGAFQVSAWHRAHTPGWGPGMWRQARHARRIFDRDGRSWREWQCRP